MISILKITKGNNSAKRYNFHTNHTGHALHCTKFHEIISKGIKVIERTQFLY